MEKKMFFKLFDIKKSLENLNRTEKDFEKATSPLISDKEKEKYLERLKKKLLR